MLFIYFCIVKLLVIDMHPWESGSAIAFLIIVYIAFAVLIWYAPEIRAALLGW
jgi:hypothetical protein